MCSRILPALQKAFCLGSWRPWKPKDRKRGKGPETAGPTLMLLGGPRDHQELPLLSACLLQDRLGNGQRKHGGAQRASAARPSPAARLPAPQTAFLPLYGSQPLGTTWQAHPMTPRDVTHTCRPLLCPGLERLRDEVGKETVEAPSDRKGNEKGTTALPCGGRPTGKTCLPLTEITRGFPGKTGMEVLLTSHLKRQNTSEHTCSP